MGCDIHLHAEVKIKGQWHHYSAANIDRNYDLFGKLAGVRRDFTPIAAPKGLPQDLSVVTAVELARWNTAAHTHSWLNAAEIRALKDWGKTQSWWKCATNFRDWEDESVGYLFDNDWSGFVTHPHEYPPDLEDIRWVFWFDN
jgi:hypothetical protein